MTDAERYGFLSHRAHRAACFGFLLLAGVLGGGVAVAYNALFAGGGDWPYDVKDRKLVSEYVQPAGEIGMSRLIDYHQEDCWRQYDRRAVSRVQTGDKPGMVFRFDPYVDQRLPIDLSGKWQTWTDKLPEDFTCGPAYLAESITAACTRWQRWIRPLRKADVITPFNVTCPPAG
jgi:hypothetical protein